MIYMGLLEKAGKIQTEENSKSAGLKAQVVTPEPVVLDPNPVKIAKKSKKQRKERVPKKAKQPRSNRTRVVKELPVGFEHATRGQILTRRFVDFSASYGWSIPVIGLAAWGGGNSDPTYLYIGGILLVILNLLVLPSQTGRSLGNWVSRTRYVNTSGDPPLWGYVFLKGLTTVFVLIGLYAILNISGSGLGDTTISKVFSIVGLLMILPPLIDYAMYRFRKDSKLGLWDTLFGRVWIVRTNKSAEAKGWLKRLESLGDYAESRGLLSDKEE
ncbi:MAG: hypothetical protein ACI9EM_000760 [Candidatus Thalassarchaeaceae archaeon]|jgi:uncharacterized RDD family membrane protein YckC|tara:strand:+ start:1089 stop:1901 length:813 start_codon:yes stop_codon:yes gene_type:complete